MLFKVVRTWYQVRINYYQILFEGCLDKKEQGKLIRKIKNYQNKLVNVMA